jgi:hypothetical protein
VAVYIYYCTVCYSFMARIKLCEILQGEANKSAVRCGNLRAKGGVVPPSVILALLVCGSNTFLLPDFAAYFYLQQYVDVGMEQQVDLSSAFLTNWRSSRREEAADLHATEAENDLTRYNRG